MERSIRAIFLDLGGTFRIVEDNIPYKTAARQRIAALTGTSMEAESFHSLIEQRYDAYRDFEERGEHFRRLVDSWMTTKTMTEEQALEAVVSVR